MIPTRILRRSLSATCLAAAVFAAPAQAAFTSLTIFGDSLSDSGNNAIAVGVDATQVITGNTYIPTFTYGSGTYTNGNVWATAFAAGLGLPQGGVASFLGGGNRAAGGARTVIDPPPAGYPFSATTQLNQYLALPSTPASFGAGNLFVIAIGGNDLRDAAGAAAADPGNAVSILSTAAASFAAGVGNMVDALQARGAQNIVVWGAPNVGRTPFSIATNTVAAGTFASGLFNSALNTRLTGEAGVIRFDASALVDAVASNPGAYGLSNVTQACGALAVDPSSCLFWDGIHPSAAGHALLANAMLAAVPEPSAVLLMLAGLAGVGLAARRRRGPAATPAALPAR